MKTYPMTFFHFLAMGYLLSFFACAGPSTQQIQTSKEQLISESKEVQGVEKIQLTSMDNIPIRAPLKADYDNIIFTRFECNAQFQRDYPNALTSCKESIISQLQSKKAYKHVTDNTNKKLSGKNILVDMKIVDMRIVSDSARIWGSYYVGNSWMEVLLELRDADTKEVVHRKVLSTSNNFFAAAWTGGSTDKSLPSDLGTLIGGYIFRVVPSTK